MNNSTRQFTNALSKFFAGSWGYTGTRQGMTEFQQTVCRRVLEFGLPAALRHGGADGGDMEMHAIWRETRESVLMVDMRVRVYPADRRHHDRYLRQEKVSVEEPRPPLERNELIARRSEFLLGAPRLLQEEQRSGTWHTIRTARALRVPVLIVWPDNDLLTLERFTAYRQMEHHFRFSTIRWS